MVPIFGMKKRGNFIVLGVSFISDNWEYYYEFGVKFTEENVFFKVKVLRMTYGSINNGNFLFAQTK